MIKVRWYTFNWNTLGRVFGLICSSIVHVASNLFCKLVVILLWYLSVWAVVCIVTCLKLFSFFSLTVALALQWCLTVGYHQMYMCTDLVLGFLAFLLATCLNTVTVVWQHLVVLQIWSASPLVHWFVGPDLYHRRWSGIHLQCSPITHLSPVPGTAWYVAGAHSNSWGILSPQLYLCILSYSAFTLLYSCSYFL